MTYSYRWSHLKDLPENAMDLADVELHTLRKVWLEQKGGLEESGLVADFNERLVREYAIEGGIIERAYTLERGITQLLIDRGIDGSLIPKSATNKDPEYVANMIKAHQSVIGSVFDLINHMGRSRKKSWTSSLIFLTTMWQRKCRSALPFPVNA